jgi:hypothetical protein
MEYWKVVHQAIQLNPIEERDMAVLQGLRNLGIEKGKPFNPTPDQQEILEEAALVGETWAMGNSFLKRDPVKHWTDDPKSQWQYILFMESPLDQMTKTHMEIDARSAYTYEAVTMSAAATMNLVDAGIQYLAAYKDDAGRWLDGAKTYELVVPKDVPMLNFWSVVLYDNDTRCMIENPQGKTEVNSRQELVKNADGSVRLVFSPQKPADVPEANWIQTNPKKGFFAYFRWYSPTKAFFDRSWKMGNIKEVNRTISRSSKNITIMKTSLALSSILGLLLAAPAHAQQSHPGIVSGNRATAPAASRHRGDDLGDAGGQPRPHVSGDAARDQGPGQPDALLVAPGRLEDPDAHAQHRCHLFHALLRYEGGRTGRDGDSAGRRRRHRWHDHGCLADAARGCGPGRRGPGQGWEVSHSAAGSRREGARRLHRSAIAHLQGIRIAALHFEQRKRRRPCQGGGVWQTDQDLPLVAGAEPGTHRFRGCRGSPLRCHHHL